VAVSYNTTLKNTRLSAVVTAIGSAGYIQVCTSGYGTVLATIPLANPAGAVAGGVLTLTTPVSDATADATGTAAVARIKDSGGTVIASGLTVGTSGTDITIASTSIVASQVVTINSATITHAA